MKRKFWVDNHQQLIEDYLLNEDNRLSIITKLTPIIIEIIERAASKLQYHLSEDDRQDVYIHIITRVLTKLTMDKKQAALNYIYLASRNYLLSEVIKFKRKKIYIDDIDSFINNEQPSMIISDDSVDERKEAQQEIIRLLDLKTVEQEGNRNHILFILMVKHYLIEHQFCEIGLQDYICAVMKIKLSTFRSLCSRVGIKGKIFDNK